MSPHWPKLASPCGWTLCGSNIYLEQVQGWPHCAPFPSISMPSVLSVILPQVVSFLCLKSYSFEIKSYSFYVYFLNILLSVLLNVPSQTSFETFLSPLLSTQQANGITCSHHILKFLSRIDKPLCGFAYKRFYREINYMKLYFTCKPYLNISLQMGKVRIVH